VSTIESKLKKSKEDGDGDNKLIPLHKTLSNSGESLIATPISAALSDDNLSAKRKLSPQNEEQDKKKCKVDENKPLCQYGSKCYRKNPQHFKEFSHPHL